MHTPSPPLLDDLPRLSDPLFVGGCVSLSNRVVLAPMSGVSDAPFRALAESFGAGMVVSEMIASELLAGADPGSVQRTRRAGKGPFVIQLTGREARWMGEAARVAEALGADMVDINMGCPARKVTGGCSGSALMRDPDFALTLIEAVVAAVSVPVALKMRLGWDHQSINAPDLARRAENAGIRLVTVHGRTRCQFFKGCADWDQIRKVKHAVTIPVIANGDVTDVRKVENALHRSGADAVMIGRGAYGAPWMPGRIAAGAHDILRPPANMPDLVENHFDEMLAHYGNYLGVRNARKHLGWYVARIHGNTEHAKDWRSKLCRSTCPRDVRRLIRSCFAGNDRIAA